MSELARYVVLNPVRAGMTATAGQWRWSNYRATGGLGPAPAWLEKRPSGTVLWGQVSGFVTLW